MKSLELVLPVTFAPPINNWIFRWFCLGCLAGAFASALPAAQILIPAGAHWSYQDNGSNQGTAWRFPDFDDSAWRSGPAQLGYGDEDERTTVQFGGDSNNKHPTTYFRHAFQLTNASLLEAALRLELVRDDGAIVYLNGREVFRSNMPGGTVTYTTYAAGTTPNATENEFVEQMLPAGDLVLGTNLVAVEVHQASGTSSDISFDLRLSEGLGFPGADLTRGPYLQMVTPDSVTLRWRTDVAVNSLVRWGVNPFQLDATNFTSSITTEHVVKVRGLSPGVRYYYSVGTSTGILTEGLDHSFMAAPSFGSTEAKRVWVLGDSGKANTGAVNVRNGFLSFAGSRPADLVLMLGDNAYESGTDSEMQNAIFNMYPAVLRQSALWPALGNHDAGNTTSPPLTWPHFVNFTLPTGGEAGGEPSGTEKYFSFDYGNVHFVCLDSYSSGRSANGAMANWLRRDLAGHGGDWVVAYWHHPPYSRGSSNSDSTTESVQMRQALLPILEEYGVDLVLAGHSHAYERSVLIDGHYGSSGTFNGTMIKDGGDGRENGDGVYYKLAQDRAHQGTVYIVAGTSSQADGSVGRYPAMEYVSTALGSLVLDFDGQRLDARFINVNGSVLDYFTIVKQLPEQVVITRQPSGGFVPEGGSIFLQVRAISADPLAYQWRQDGVPITGATNDHWQVFNAEPGDNGFYDVVVANGVSSEVSEPARVQVLVAPIVLNPNPPLQLSVVQGQDVVLGVQITNTATRPIYYRWRRGYLNIVTTPANGVLELDAHSSFLHWTNVQPSEQFNSHEITIIISNAAFFPTLFDIHTNAYLTVLADMDGDTLPDIWEARYGLNEADDSDADMDSDGDGFRNRDEYTAGTDPLDAQSFLRIERIDWNGGIDIEFLAVSNRSYTVQAKEGLLNPVWVKWRDVVPAGINRMLRLHDPVGSSNRYYRLLTPRSFAP